MLICEGRHIYVVLEGRRPLCWSCRAAGQLSKVFHGKKPEAQSQPQNSKKNEGPRGWTEIVKKRTKVATPTHQLEPKESKGDQ